MRSNGYPSAETREGALNRAPYFTAEAIMRAALYELGLTWPELATNERSTRVVRARVYVTGALRELGRDLSYPEIASMTGRRHHSSTWAQYRKWLRVEPDERTRWCRRVLKRVERMNREHARNRLP